MLHTSKKIYGAAFAAVIALCLAACGGGGSGSSPLPSSGGGTTNTPVTNQTGKAKMSILIPAKASSSKGQYVSSSTQSMTIALGSTQIGEIDLTATSSNCTAGAGGSRTCSATFDAPVGTNEIFAVTMWDQTGGKGNKLSTGSVSATIQAGNIAQVPITLDGVPVSAQVVLGVGQMPVGNPGTTSVTVVAKDSGGNVIVGPGGYSTPITLAISGDTYNTMSLSEQSVTSPGQTITLTYSGGSNLGATITPSVGATAGTAANFTGTGTATNSFTFQDLADGYYSYSYGTATIPNTNTVAMLLSMNTIPCCGSGISGIAIVGPTGVRKVFTGDQVDPVTTASPTYTGMTLVHGMSQRLQTWEGQDVEKEIAVSPNGTIYYGGSYATNYPGCAGRAYDAGTIGALNPAAGTTSEQVTHGAPMYMQLDSSGTLWFVEATPSYCDSSGGLPVTYYIGKLTGSGALTETSFATAGLPNDFPGSMQLSNDGTQMYIGFDYSNATDGNIAQVALPALGSPTTLTLTNSRYIDSMAMAPDGTMLWASNTNPGNFNMYGYLPAGKAFSATNIVENSLPIQSDSSYGMNYGDGSFWVGNNSNGGIIRMNGWGAGTMQTNWYQFPSPNGNAPQITGVQPNAGYIYAGDDSYGNIYVMQYGAPGSTTLTSNGKAAQIAPAPMTVHYPQGMSTQPRNPHAGRNGYLPAALKAAQKSR